MKEFLQKKYENPEAFLKNVIFPVFGEDNYDDSGSYHWLRKHPEDQTAADNSGILDILVLGSIYVEGSQLDIFDITVASKHQLANSRVGIQQLIRRIISTHSGAFMIFHYKTTERWDWRFTFCHKGASQLDSSDAKRYTFLLGPGQSCRTAAENFCKLGEKIATNGEFEMDDIIKAFDVEALSKEFFDKYKAQYEKFVNYMADAENGMREDFIDTDFDTEGLTDEEIHSREEKPLRDYVKKLLGRIVFLHFIQKKGWLGVEPGKDWGEGDMDFMMNLFEKSTESQKDNFLDEVLEPIFEQALNTDRSDKDDLFDTGVKALPNKGVLKIPYLNGGLFEREASDEPDSVFPAEYFQSLLTFLYQYNFTIDENDPNDAQVGIDPEMLGRIFENLLEDNKDKGAFYTPKEIVQYMCRESLIAYLQTDKADDEKQTIRDFVSSYDVAPLSETLRKDIDSKLRSVKICDPAIGSGAFPMGLLKEIFYCRGAIENFDESAEIKKDIIQNNIYGVDIEKGAVDIARLRFWLSIIVDEKAPHCLPNMDFKIMQGNSLIEDYRGIDLSGLANGSGRKKKKGDDGTQLSLNFGTEDVLENIHIQMDAYYKLSDHKKKNETREVINELVKTYIKKYTLDNPEISAEIDALPIPNDQFFLWHTYFADVFQNGGFDIVIGNPPYIDSESMVKQGMGALREFLKNKYATLSGNWDMYMAFMALGLSIGNVCTFITPDKWLSKPFGLKFREISMKDQLSIITRAGSRVFENVTVDAIITLFKPISGVINAYEFAANKSVEYLSSAKSESLCEPYLIDYLFSPYKDLIIKLDRIKNKFSSIAVAEGACATSDAYNLKPFIVENEDVDMNREYMIINTGTIGRYTSKWGKKQFTYLGDKYLYPVVDKTSFNKAFGRTYIRRSASSKVIFKGLNLLDACLDLNGEILPGKTTMTICHTNPDILKIICALINSKLLFFYVKNKYSSSSYCGGLTFTGDMINYMPLPEIPSSVQNKIVSLVDNIRSSQADNPDYDFSQEQKLLDDIIYSIYGISLSEKQIIEDSLS